jgi:hypothetical protein
MSTKYNGLEYQTCVDWINVKNIMVYYGYIMIFKYFDANVFLVTFKIIMI